MLLAFLAFILIFVGLVKPSLVLRWGNPEKKTRLKAAGTYALAMVLCFVIGSMTMPSEEASTAKEENKTEESNTEVNKNEESNVAESNIEEESSVEESNTEEYDVTASDIGAMASSVDAYLRGVDEGEPITESSLQFLEEHLDIFMEHNQSSALELVDSSIDYRHLEKNIDEYSGAMYMDYGVIVSIEESDGLTAIHLLNLETEVSYMILYIGETDFLEEDTLEFIGLPLMNTHFENVSGGYTNAIVMLASNLNATE